MSAEKPPRRPRSARTSQPAVNKNSFSSSLADSLGEALAQKLKRQVEDNIKKRIKQAINDPKVKAASQKFSQK